MYKLHQSENINSLLQNVYTSYVYRISHEYFVIKFPTIKLLLDKASKQNPCKWTWNPKLIGATFFNSRANNFRLNVKIAILILW